MGIPDLMRFVARDAAGALRRVPASGNTSFDYVLVDLTNAMQTLKPAVLTKLLTVQLRANTALVLVVDGQRQRQGTAREQRQFLQQRDADVTVQQIASALLGFAGTDDANALTDASGAKRARAEAAPSRAVGSKSQPRVVLVGREVAGEGDYKLLSIHRRLVTLHEQRSQRATSAATPTAAARPTFLLVSEDSDVLCGAMCGPCPQDVTIATTLHDALHEVHFLSVGPILRRLYSTSGLLVATAAAAVASSNAAPSHFQPVSMTEVAAAAPKKVVFGDDDDDTGKNSAEASVAPAAPVRLSKVLPQQQDVQSAALDFIFLFALVLGSSTTPPITKGATRVDAAACWQHYANLVAGNAKLRSGRVVDARTSLLRFATSGDDSPASVFVDAELFSTLLEGARFADDRSRVPTADERKYAREFIKHLVRSTVALMVGAPTDSRADVGKFATAPSVSCLTTVLEAHEERAYQFTFDFSLYPVAQVAAADRGGVTEPLMRLPIFLDGRTFAQAGRNPPSNAVAFWPPHDGRPLVRGGDGGTNARLVAAQAPVPLGAYPKALNVSLAVLASQFAASVDNKLYTGAHFVTIDSSAQLDVAEASATLMPSSGNPAAAQSQKGARVGTTNLTFNFDMRRMVPNGTSAAADDADEEAERVAKREKAKATVLAAAGLTQSYYDGPAALAARQAWDAAGKAKKSSSKFSASKPTPVGGAAPVVAQSENIRAVVATPAAASEPTPTQEKKKKKGKRLGKRERALAAKKAVAKSDTGSSATGKSKQWTTKKTTTTETMKKGTKKPGTTTATA
jgi:hypothetical protein